VTNAQYARYVEGKPALRRPSTFANERFNAPEQPVVCVSWHDASRFAASIGGRLPTEAEWEYACRAGTLTSTYAGELEGEEDARLDAIAWHRRISDDRTHPVGEKQPNAWGLHDMLGNVWEWCADTYRPYTVLERHGDGYQRVVRGGCWNNRAKYARAARRDGGPVGREDWRIGFRVAMNVE